MGSLHSMGSMHSMGGLSIMGGLPNIRGPELMGSTEVIESLMELMSSSS